MNDEGEGVWNTDLSENCRCVCHCVLQLIYEVLIQGAMTPKVEFQKPFAKADARSGTMSLSAARSTKASRGATGANREKPRVILNICIKLVLTVCNGKSKS